MKGTGQEPTVAVGILTAQEMTFTLLSSYRYQGNACPGNHLESGISPAGTHHIHCQEGLICWNGHLYDELCFTPEDGEHDSFKLHEVCIGIGFHWERKEDQCFQGALRITCSHGMLTAINRIGVEAYLTSVISSEMSANASPELLKAHAVISRSWLMANLASYRGKAPTATPTEEYSDEGAVLRWYERDSHTGFDVCADDHCQRYQGITRILSPAVRQAVSDTCGEVLTYEGKICDARFSKCCGGMLEEFQYCWARIRHPYLTARRDSRSTAPLPLLTDEENARRWICSTPDSFCHTRDTGILAQVLNGYDQETKDFYRWRVEYSQEELSELVKRRSGIDYGLITALEPLARGTSGRIWKLRIVGTLRSGIIGKELEIRRTLSPTHLYSSAFVVDKTEKGFVLNGAGWGHGVGLCQIGAAVMGSQGYDYRSILQHYYPGTYIETCYQPIKRP